MKSKYLIKGIIKSIPGIEYVYQFNKRTGGSSSARYCYSVWLRHLIFAFENGMTEVPKVIAELGPGDSLGVGIAALISGTEKYYALDVKRYNSYIYNLDIFDQLVSLFRQRSDIPNESEFPRIRPFLDSYKFPRQIFSDDYLTTILDEKRLEKIRRGIKDMELMKAGRIEYVAPWNKSSAVPPNSIDFIISQAVLQAVDNLELLYKMMFVWLKPDGMMSHDLGFKSCGSADKWYGHWEYSDLEWKIVRGRKSFFINREPYSTHIDLLRRNRFDILFEKRETATEITNKNRLARKFQYFSEEDLSTFSLFYQARRGV